MIQTLAVPLALILATAPEVARPAPIEVDRSVVPADTPYLVHVDVRGFLETSFAKALIDLAGDELMGEMDLDEIEEEFGINPLEDIKSITVFSVTGDLEEGVALLRTTSAIESVLERAQQDDEYRSWNSGGVRLHGFGDDGDDEMVAYIHSGGGNDRWVVVSDDEDDVLRAVAVLRGDAPSLADARTPRIKSKPIAGAFLFVEVADGFDELTDDSPASQIGAMVRRFALQAGERRGEMYVRAALDTKSGEDAENVSNILKGLKSLAKLAGDEVPQIAMDLLDSIDVTTSGTLVRLGIDFDGRRLAEELTSLEDGDW